MSDDFLKPGYEKYSDNYMESFKTAINKSFSDLENANSIFENEDTFKEECKKFYTKGMTAQDFCNEFAATFNISPDEISEVFSTVVDLDKNSSISDEEFENFALGMYEMRPTSLGDTTPASSGEGSVPEAKAHNELSDLAKNSAVVDDNFRYTPYDTTGLEATVKYNEKKWSTKDKKEAVEYRDSAGNLRKEDKFSYSSGEIQSSKIYDENGRLVREEYYTNGKVSSVAIMDENGNKKEVWKFDKDGTLKTASTYNADGSVDKNYSTTFKDGSLSSTRCTYSDGSSELTNYENGKVTKVTTMDSSNSTNSIKFYDSDGNLEKEHRYITKDGKKIIEVFDKNGKSTGTFLNLDGTPYVEPTTTPTTAPTTTPTTAPTTTPTTPSETPTTTPTTSPGETPTTTPSTGETPTETPTATPTAAPSETPTAAPTVSQAEQLQALDIERKTQRLIEAMEGNGTDEKVVKDIIMDENLTGEELVEIMKKYKELSDRTLIEDICKDFSAFSTDVTEETLRNRMFELLQEQINEKTDYDTNASTEVKQGSVAVAKDFNHFGHDNLIALFDKKDPDFLVRVATEYGMSHPDQSFMKQVCGETFAFGKQEEYIALIINSYFEVLTNLQS